MPAWWWIWLPACVAGGGVWWMTKPPAPAGALAPTVVVAQRSAVAASADSRQDAAHARLPSLAGVDVPPGPELDDHGNLRLTRALRGYYDFFLSARHDAGNDAALDAVVDADIRTRVPEPAATQAWQLWSRYRDYLAQARQLAADRTQLSAAAGAVSMTQVAQWRAQLDARRALRQRQLPDVATLWFGEDDAYDAAMLARLEVAAQPGLSAAERQRRLDAADDNLPGNVRALRAQGERPQRIGETIGKLQADGRSTQDIAAALAQAYGADVAQRYQQQAQADQAWQDRYADYARQRAQIEQFPGLSDTDRLQQIEQLRKQSFAEPAEGLRAYVRDKAAAARAARAR